MYFSLFLKLKISLLVLLSLFLFAPVLAFEGSSPLVINEFQISGESSTQLHEEYLVLKNVSSGPFDLKDCVVSKSATSAKLYPLYTFDALVLDAGDTLKLAHLDYTGTADYRFIAGTSNTLSTSNSIVLDCGARAGDKVGFGDGFYFEKTHLLNPSYGQIYTREGEDTDDNLVDFVLFVEPVKIDLNASRLVISELLPNPETGEEWFELFNPTSLDISLANLKICDVLGARHCYPFNDSDVITANSYKTYGQAATKITLNNSGDWLELYDVSDNLLTDTGGNYGTADKGISLALFGDEYLWTKSITPAATNVFTDTVELETDTATSTAKRASTKTVKTSKKVASTTGGADLGGIEAEAEVKAAETADNQPLISKTLVSKKTIGWALIGLAILLVLGYTLWYFRDYAKEIYHKIKPGDDSARF